MRYLILSDSHANLEALDAVLAHADAQGYDRVLMLGDLVGYGADPNAVTERLRGLDAFRIIRGNHDKVAAGVESPDGFNAAARKAVEWTAAQLTPENRAYLAALPQGPVFIGDEPDGIQICHGSPDDEDEYLFDASDAVRALRHAERALCLFGHTHVQVVYQLSPDDALDVSGAADVSGRRLALQPGYRYLVNPGSVGQPRDGDPRAAYGLLDIEARELLLFRVPYPIAAAQEKIRRAGLPDVLATRLGVGR